MTTDPPPPANPDWSDEQWRTLRVEWTAMLLGALMTQLAPAGAWAEMAVDLRALWDDGGIDPSDGLLTREVVLAEINRKTDRPTAELIAMIRRGEISQAEAMPLIAARFRAIRQGRRQGGLS